MIDYREEKDFKISLIIFLVDNFSENSRKRNVLTLEKLKLLFIICLTPRKLNEVSKILNGLSISNYKHVFYDDSSDSVGYAEMKDVSLVVSYMCNENYLEIVNEETRFLTLGKRSVEFSREISKGAPRYLVNNKKLIRKIISRSERQITKALMES